MIHAIDIGHAQLNVLDLGAGPPLLLVHGFPLNNTLWRHQAAALAATHRVIAPDLRGFGRSSPVTGTVTMAEHADDLARLLDALEIQEPVHLCSLSMGGYVSLEFWRRYPTRLRSLILCDTKAAADTPEAAANREKMAVDALREGSIIAEKAMLPKLLAADAPRRQPEVVEEARQMIQGTRPETIASAQRGMAQRADMTPHLGQIALPTLLIVGELDVISTPKEMQGIAASISHSRLITIPAVGHLTPLEAPVEFTTALQGFLVEKR